MILQQTNIRLSLSQVGCLMVIMAQNWGVSAYVRAAEFNYRANTLTNLSCLYLSLSLSHFEYSHAWTQKSSSSFPKVVFVAALRYVR